MPSKIIPCILGVLAILAGLGIALFWQERLVPLFVPLVSGAFLNAEGEVRVTDTSAPLKLMLLTRDLGWLPALSGICLFLFSSLPKRSNPAGKI